MPCYKPISGRRRADGTITMKGTEGYYDRPVKINCGRCQGCRLERSRQWSVRCMHEASMHEKNAFLTLTYDDEHLPKNGSLNVEHWQKFARRVRKKMGKFRFFHCGEYGDENRRPHYHALIFGQDWTGDRRPWTTDRGHQLYRSEQLEQLWTMGQSVIGEVTWQSASYVARYLMKKVTGDDAADHYQGRKPEYVTMSRRPGVGRKWIERYNTDVYPNDFVVVEGKRMRPPKYYDNFMGETREKILEEVKDKRKQKGREHQGEKTEERLKVREKVQEAKAKLTQRKI